MASIGAKHRSQSNKGARGWTTAHRHGSLFSRQPVLSNVGRIFDLCPKRYKDGALSESASMLSRRREIPRAQDRDDVGSLRQRAIRRLLLLSGQSQTGKM